MSILAEPVAAQVPPSTATFPEGKNVVEIPFTRFRDWIIARAKVNDGKELSFILDTGAPIAVFGDERAGEALGLNIVGQARVAGGEGQPPKTVPLATGVKFTLGGLEIGNCMVAIGAASDAISGVDGVIGKYVFENAVVEINWEKSKLVITKPEYFQYEGNGTTIPLKIAATGHIYGEVTIEKNGNRKKITIIRPASFSMNPVSSFIPGGRGIICW